MSKVIVGLSGGVDSAVAAYLLKQQGHEVIGAFMRNWDAFANNDIKGNPTIFNDVCPQEEDYHDAQLVAEKLGIPLLRVDFIKEYWDHVFTYFLDEYKKGRTPNPDILCNKYIKFSSFLKFAMDQGADYIATGHYARVRKTEDKIEMLRGIDDNKDQTYFLCLLTQEQLSKTIFPIGDLPKPEVRRIALELDLPVAKKKDSTGICFIGERNFRQFLQNYIPAKEGDIVDIKTNEVVGKHNGVMYYTIGQRKGLGIGGIKDHQTGSWFVVKKDVEKRILYVAQGEENKYLFSKGCYVDGINWISKEIPTEPIHITCKFRYRQKDVNVTVEFINESEAKVICDETSKAITPGQECVFYDKDVCLGGGTIQKLIK